MKLKLGLAAALLAFAPMGFAGDANPAIADVIAQIEARRNDKAAAEGKAAQDRANEEKPAERGNWGNRGGQGGGQPGGQGGGGMSHRHGGQGGQGGQGGNNNNGN